MSHKFITVSPYHYSNALTLNGEKLSGAGLDIHWRGLTWDEYHRAIVCNDLETQSCERSSAFSADTREVDRACALVALDAEADVDVPLKHLDRARHPRTAIKIPRRFGAYCITKDGAYVFALAQLTEYTAHCGARETLLVGGVG